MSASAVEITIRHLLVKPILNGLVHNEAVADVVMALAPWQTGSEGFKALLFGVLNKVADVDLTTYKRAGACRTLDRGSAGESGWFPFLRGEPAFA